MSSNRLFYVFVVVALVVMAGLTVRQALTTTQAVSAALSRAPDQPERAASSNAVNVTQSYRSALGKCFDVPLKEAVGCRAANQTLDKNIVDNTRTYRLLRNRYPECFDVPLREAARCHEASRTHTSTPFYRDPLAECFDVPLREREAAGCNE